MSLCTLMLYNLLGDIIHSLHIFQRVLGSELSKGLAGRNCLPWACHWANRCCRLRAAANRKTDHFDDQSCPILGGNLLYIQVTWKQIEGKGQNDLNSYFYDVPLSPRCSRLSLSSCLYPARAIFSQHVQLNTVGTKFRRVNIRKASYEF